MIPGTYNLEIYKGDTFLLYVRIQATNSNGAPGEYIDLTGNTPKAQIRATPTNPTVLAEFTATLDNQTTNMGGITLMLTPAQTAALTNGVWDLQTSNAGGTIINTYLAGTVMVIEEVTRA